VRKDRKLHKKWLFLFEVLLRQIISFYSCTSRLPTNLSWFDVSKNIILGKTKSHVCFEWL